jgi:hypothetical protein
MIPELPGEFNRSPVHGIHGELPIAIQRLAEKVETISRLGNGGLFARFAAFHTVSLQMRTNCLIEHRTSGRVWSARSLLRFWDVSFTDEEGFRA